jgi:hypothetical protein
MKFAQARPYADPEAAARKLIEIANSVEAVQDGRIHIELLNGPMLFEHKATPAYSAGLKLAIERGWLVMHESGTFVKFTQTGAELFAPNLPPPIIIRMHPLVRRDLTLLRELDHMNAWRIARRPA